jgi:hypothetical protein
MLIMLGAVLVVAGLLWPWLKKTHLFHLPGNIVSDRLGFKFFFADHDNADPGCGPFDRGVVDTTVARLKTDPEANS